MYFHVVLAFQVCFTNLSLNCAFVGLWIAHICALWIVHLRIVDLGTAGAFCWRKVVPRLQHELTWIRDVNWSKLQYPNTVLEDLTVFSPPSREIRSTLGGLWRLLTSAHCLSLGEWLEDPPCLRPLGGCTFSSFEDAWRMLGVGGCLEDPLSHYLRMLGGCSRLHSLFSSPVLPPASLSPPLTSPLCNSRRLNRLPGELAQPVRQVRTAAGKQQVGKQQTD